MHSKSFLKKVAIFSCRTYETNELLIKMRVNSFVLTYGLSMWEKLSLSVFIRSQTDAVPNIFPPSTFQKWFILWFIYLKKSLNLGSTFQIVWKPDIWSITSRNSEVFKMKFLSRFEITQECRHKAKVTAISSWLLCTFIQGSFFWLKQKMTVFS